MKSFGKYALVLVLSATAIAQESPRRGAPVEGDRVRLPKEMQPQMRDVSPRSVKAPQQPRPANRQQPNLPMTGISHPPAMGPTTPQVPSTQAAATQAIATQPIQPAGPQQAPRTPPRVSYSGGELTIIAQNSGMGEILSAVSRLTGARVEGANYASSERVFGQFGPGSPRTVLDSLLSGAKFDYVLAGSLEDPKTVNHIVLTPHMTTGTNGGGMVAQQQPPQPQQQGEVEEDNDNSEQQDMEQQEQEQPIAAPPQGQQPAAQVQQPQQQQRGTSNFHPEAAPSNAQPGQPGAQPPNGAQGQQGPKTPEQLLEELKQLQQQRQQQQQQQQVPK